MRMSSYMMDVMVLEVFVVLVCSYGSPERKT